jgi:hypothetical protein
MAKDINSVTIVGRLTKDAELKYTNSGTAISNLSIAVNRSKKVGDAFLMYLYGVEGVNLLISIYKKEHVLPLPEN